MTSPGIWAYYFVCTAMDGYTTVYSWNELYNGDCGNFVMVVLSTQKSSELEDGVLMINGCDTYTGRVISNGFDP